MPPPSTDILQIKKSNVVATLLFCDVAHFTKVTISRSSGELIAQLTAYMKIVADTVTENHGTVAKFIGDAVFAYWLEDEQPEHAKLACRFAATIQERLSAAGINFESRIGVHTGRVSLVSIEQGSYRSLEPIGDAVNLASRLEGACSDFKVQAIASEQVIAHGGGGPDWTKLDTVTVKGRTAPLTLYKLE